MKDYESAMHAVQSGIAMLMNYSPSLVSGKHLRVGINSAMVTDRAVAELLIAKGVFTKDEYMDAITVAANKEVEMLEKELSELLGSKITLG
jgi:hypothetical protein